MSAVEQQQQPKKTRGVPPPKQRRRPRRRQRVSPDAILAVPFITITPNGSQMSLARNALAALGHPHYVAWSPRGAGGACIRLTATSASDPNAVIVSPCKGRLQAVTTVPKEYRSILERGQYAATSWSEPDVSPKWLEFTLTSRPRYIPG